MHRTGICLAASLIAFVCGCTDHPATSGTSDSKPNALPLTEDHPTVIAPAFRVLHQAGTIVTLVIPEKTTDDQLINLLWLLRDKAVSSSLDSIGISQSLVDHRDPIVWFQIYRGTKCASENYSKTKPCGSAEHEAGWFGYGSLASRDSNAGEIYRGPNETKSESIWDASTAYIPKPYIKAYPSSQTKTVPDAGATLYGTTAQNETATAYANQVWNGGQKAMFSVPQRSELLVQAPWLNPGDPRRLLEYTLNARRKELCAVGFKSIHMVSGIDDVGSHVTVQCRGK